MRTRSQRRQEMGVDVGRRSAVATLALAVLLPGAALAPLAATHAGAAAVAKAPCAIKAHRPWCNRSLTAYHRATLLESRMTTDEKIKFLNGVSPGVHTGASMAMPSLGIPQVDYTDGPVGPRQGKATAMPVPMAVAATFKRLDARASGREIATEAKEKGNDVVFGPTVNIMRTPEGGRTYEAYGEDPFLVASTTVSWIDGAQSTGVMADVKHFAANNQEGQLGASPVSGADGSRAIVSADVTPRVLHEVYFPQFEAAVKQAHVATVMCSYNRINNKFACEDHYLLQQTLEKQWGFKGYVVSDYGAAHSTVSNLNNGLDFEPSFLLPLPPLSSYYAPDIKAAIASDQVSMATIDEHVHRILRTWFAYGVFDRAPFVDNDRRINKPADARVAEKVEQQAIVLLRNKHHLLPLKKRSTRSIAVIGPYASAFVTGGGSGNVVPFSNVSTLDGVRRALRGHHAHLRYADGSNVKAAVAAARKSKVAVVVVGDVESEGQDKSCIGLNCSSDLSDTALPLGTYPCTVPNCPPNGKDESGLIRKVAAANRHTIVVLETGAPVVTPWRSKVGAVLEAWYPGERGGTAIARVLFGKADPSGRLPATFPRNASQLPTAGSQLKYPGVGIEEHYSEGLDVGYRWYEAHHFSPAFPFGYGKSYTHFRYSRLHVHRRSSGAGTIATVSVRIANTGRRIGSAVPELYLALPASKAVPEPPRELKGYRSVRVRPGDAVRVTFHLNARSFAYYQVSTNTWRVRPGCFGVRVGSSSSASALRLHARIVHGHARCGSHAVRVRIAKHAANRAEVVPKVATVRGLGVIR
jgi:beta-glucosidase